VGEKVNHARLVLAIAQIAGDHLTEVLAKVPEAEAFFAERGAASWVVAYRRSARRPARQTGRPGAAADTNVPEEAEGTRETVRESSGSVRSTG
jgi:hypothetical protein